MAFRARSKSSSKRAAAAAASCGGTGGAGGGGVAGAWGENGRRRSNRALRRGCGVAEPVPARRLPAGVPRRASAAPASTSGSPSPRTAQHAIAAHDGLLDDHIIRAADQQQVFNIVAPDDDEFPSLAIEREGIGHGEALHAAPARGVLDMLSAGRNAG